jgi:hypothetical protein
VLLHEVCEVGRLPTVVEEEVDAASKSFVEMSECAHGRIVAEGRATVGQPVTYWSVMVNASSRMANPSSI